MSTRANETAEPQIQDGRNTTSLGGSDGLDPHRNLMKSQEQTGICLSSQTCTLHHLATPRQGCEIPKSTQ